LPGEYVYPPGYHYLLALFPKRAREEFEKVSSALFDTLLVAVFLWLAVQELQPLGWDVSSLFLLGLSFALSPALVGIGTGPRAYQGTARTLGELMAAVVFACLWRYWSNGGWMWMAITILVSSLMLNTSKFSGQVLLFFCWLMAFLLNSATFLVFPLVCIVGAAVAHLRLYAAKIVDSHSTARARKRWIWPKNPIELAKFLLLENVYVILVMKFTVPLFALGLIAWNATFSGLSNADSFLVAWLVSAFLVFAVISMPRFLFLGEAERYLEYALVPGFLLFAALSDVGYQYRILVGFIVLQLALYIVNVGILIWLFRRAEVSNLPELIAALRTQEPTVVLSLLEWAPWELVYRTDHQVCFSESLTKLHVSDEEFERFFWRYPLPRSDFRYYVENYRVGLIAVSKWKVESAREEGCEYVFTGLDKVFENDTHLLYRVPKGYTAVLEGSDEERLIVSAP
jgi:hypothetical protein